MPDWVVRLRGRADELYALASLDSAQWRVWKEEGEYYLRCQNFSSLSDPADVRAEAREFLKVVRGAAKIDCGVFPPVDVEAIVRLGSGGEPAQGDLIRDAVFELKRPFIAGTVTRLVALALHDRAVREALIYFSEDRSWHELYRVWEVIEKEMCGDKQVDQRSWATSHELERFTRTANAHRHPTPTEPNPNPMTLREAESLIARLLASWTSAKGPGSE